MLQLLEILSVFLAIIFVVAFAWMLSTVKGRRSLQLAIRSLWLHKLRSFLSVLGIIIGTGAVIALMAFGEGSMHEALEDIKRLGATNIIIRGVKPPESNTTTQQRVAIYGLTYQDYDLFATIFKTLGVEYAKELTTPIGRPMALCRGKPIERLLG